MTTTDVSDIPKRETMLEIFKAKIFSSQNYISTLPRFKACKIACAFVAMCIFIYLSTTFYHRYRIERPRIDIFIPPPMVSPVRTRPYITMALHDRINFDNWGGRSLQTLFEDMRPHTMQTDYDFLQSHVTSAGLNITALSRLPLRYQPLEIEADILKDPPLLDILRAANTTFSRVYIVDPRPEYVIGHVVTIRLDVYNGYGEPLRRGGDVIHIRLVEQEKGAAIVGEVIDLNNGTYLSHIPVTWTGQQTVKVSIRYPREVLRTLLYCRHVMKSLRYVAAGFVGSSDSESTLCSPFPRIPGYNKLCNFSRRNDGLSWYCGHPRKPSLSCSDWSMLRDIEFPKPLPLTAAEEVLNFETALPPFPKIVNQTPSILVVAGQYNIPPPCHKTNHTATWYADAPRGFFLHRHWLPTTCTLPAPHPHLWKQCLTDTRIVLTGDSNLLMWYNRIQVRINCESIRKNSAKVWHTPMVCRREDINFIMTWQLHGYPEHPNSDHWATLDHFRSACHRIKAVPDTGRYLVIFHLYVHFTIHHYSVFAQRLRCIRNAIEDLINRNPDAMVFVRGPHTAFKGWIPVYGGDLTLGIYLELIKREFRGLYDRVVLLNLWDMTVAGDNTDYHPDEWIDEQMVDVMLGYACNY